MDLYKNGRYDITKSNNLSNHSNEVKELWQAFKNKENKRVPITYACDEHTWLKVSGNTFKEFYTNPQAHLMTQLEGKHWFLNNVRCDIDTSLPEEWVVCVQNWMDENELFGCDVIYQGKMIMHGLSL